MKNISTLIATTLFCILFCLPVFSEEDQCKIHVEPLGLKSEYVNHLDSDTLYFLKRRHLGAIVSVENLPSEEEQFITLVERPLFKYGFQGFVPEEANQRFNMSKEKLLLCQKDLDYPHPVVLIFSSAGYLPGERVIIRLLNHKEEELAQVAFIPCPLRKNFKDGAKVSLECLSLESSRYRVILSGFGDDETVKMESVSGFERIPPNDLPIKKGRLEFFYSIGVVGMDGGVSRLTIIREDGEKIVQMIPWGNKLSLYLSGKLAHGDKIF